MKKLFVLGTFMLGSTCLTFAQTRGLLGGGPAPEIDPSQAISGLALLFGGTMAILGRRRRA